MPILQDDLKLVRSVSNAQYDYSAGALTATVIADNNIGALISPIDPVAEAVGRVFYYKGGMVVDTATTDILLNATIFLSEKPSDALIQATLCSTGNSFDKLAAIRSYVEAYYSPSTPWDGYLYGTQAAGMGSLIIFQHPNTALPDIGATFAIIQDGGTSGVLSEFVVVSAVTSQTETFTLEGKSVTWLVVTVTLQNRLQNSYVGSALGIDDPVNPRTILFNTFASQQAQYYGVVQTTADLAAGNLTVDVDSIFNQLVPTATSDTALVDLSASGTIASLVSAATATTSIQGSTGVGFSTMTFYTSVPIARGSLTVSTPDTTYTDDGLGNLYAGSVAFGSVDYINGKVIINGSRNFHAGTATLVFTPCALVPSPSQTASIAITSSNQRTSYSITLPTQPQPGTLQIYYRAGGNDYLLTDRGDGICAGFDSSYGVAKLTYLTKSVVVSLATLPDPNTYIFFAWGMACYTFDRGSATLGKGWIVITTTAALAPLGFSIAWNDGSGHTATDDGVGNIVSSAATGQVFYSTNTIWLMPNTLPPPGTDFVVTITPRQRGTDVISTIDVNPSSGDTTITLSHTNLLQGSLTVVFNSATDADVSGSVTMDAQFVNLMVSEAPALMPVYTGWQFKDNGSGINGLSDSAINYVAGTLTFKPQWNQQVKIPLYASANVGTTARYTFMGFSTGHHTYQGLSATISYYYGDAASTVTEHHSGSALVIDVTPGLNEQIIPGSVSFTLGGLRYVDQNYQLYSSIDTTTGAGTLSGVLDPMTGFASLSVWPEGQSNSPALQSCATRVGADVVDEVTFRSPGSPVAASSVQITCTDSSGNALSGTADGSGNIATTGMAGTFFYACGLGSVRFGDWVIAAGNESQPWYSTANVSGLNVWRPRQVIASTIKFDCSIVSFMLVDASIVNIDANRLPATGMVPIIQRGDLLLLHNTQTTSATATAGGTVSVGRTNLENIWVRDANGALLPTTKYTTDLANGVLTWAAPLDLTGFASPFTLYNRKMHMSRCTRADLSGQLALEMPPTWTIPAGSKVSSAMIVGDLQGRVSNLFTQGSWDINNSWVEATPNTTPTAVYNQTEYPLGVTNRSNTDSYALIFTDTTHYNILSKNRGQLATYIPTTADYTLMDLVTGYPEFVIYTLGLGAGWMPGNVLRFDIIGAKFPWDLVLTVLPGPHASLTVDHCTIEFFGGV